MRPLGHTLLWAGFLAAAFSSVYRLEQSGERWATIPWIWYGVSMAVGILGIVLLRKAQDHDHADEAKTDAEFSVVKESLALLTSAVDGLCKLESNPSEVLHRIDNQCAEPFANFVEARQALVKRFGLTVYADVMTEFAAAERYVNRSWSAAADGYVDEIVASLGRAKQHLKNAGDLVSAAEKSA